MNGTLWPSRYSASYDIDKLTDGQYASNFGTWTASGNVNYLQVTLDSTSDAAMSMEIWAGDGGFSSSSGYLTVYVSTTHNFTATGTVCVRGTAITIGTSGVITCPAITGALYGERPHLACICPGMQPELPVCHLPIPSIRWCLTQTPYY